MERGDAILVRIYIKRFARMDIKGIQGSFRIRNKAHPAKKNEDRPRRGTKFAHGTRHDICCRHELSLFWTTSFRSNIHHICHKRQLFQAPDTVISGRIWFIPNGCRTSEAFQVYLYSYAVPQC